jgi:branched-chain amino acid transport system permease protein
MKKPQARVLWLGALGILAAAGLSIWKPSVLVFGIQRAGLYAAIALPMALVLGIVGIVNLAHGEFMMIGAYLAYWLAVRTGLDPLLALLPVAAALFLIGMLSYRLTIRQVLSSPELNQLILTFGVAMILSQGVNLIATSQPRKLSAAYVSASATLGALSFGVFDFVYAGLAVIILAGLLLFLRRTRLGKAAVAVGQNPRGARLVGINVDRTYMIVFSIAMAVLGVMGTLFLVRQSIFPGVGSPYTMKSFCLVAMAGIGNLPGILWCSLGLGLAEAFIKSFRGYGDWSDIVFFALIIIVIFARSQRRKDA